MFVFSPTLCDTFPTSMAR